MRLALKPTRTTSTAATGAGGVLGYRVRYINSTGKSVIAMGFHGSMVFGTREAAERWASGQQAKRGWKRWEITE